MTARSASGACNHKSGTTDLNPTKLLVLIENLSLRTSNILLIGLKALGTEIAKNLVLTGIGSLTIVDDDPVTENDLGAQFFVSEEHIGQIVW